MPETIFLGGFYRALDRSAQTRAQEARIELEDRELALRRAKADQEAADRAAAQAAYGTEYDRVRPPTLRLAPNVFSAVSNPGSPLAGEDPAEAAARDAFYNSPPSAQKDILDNLAIEGYRGGQQSIARDRLNAQSARWDRLDEMAAQRLGLSREQYIDLRDHRAAIRDQGQQRIDMAGQRQDDLQAYRAQLNADRDRQYELERRAMGLRAGTPEDDQVKAMQDDLGVARTLYRAAAAEAAGLDGLLTTPAQRAEVTRRFEAAEANLLRAGEQLKQARIRAGAAKRSAAAPAAASDELLVPIAPTPTPGVVQIHGDDDYEALPSGAVFIGPDGKRRRKP